MSRVRSCRHGVAIDDVLGEADAAALEAGVPHGKLRSVTENWAKPLFDAVKRHIDELAAPFGPHGEYLFPGYARWYGKEGEAPKPLHVDPLPDGHPRAAFMVAWYGGSFRQSGGLEYLYSNLSEEKVRRGLIETRRNTLVSFRPWEHWHRGTPFEGQRLFVPVLVSAK